MTDDGKVSQGKPAGRTGGIAARFSNQNPNCTVCGKAAYFMERLEADGKFYHKTCFRCTECNKTLSAGNFAALRGVMYCKPHFKQLFKLKGNYDDSFQQKKSALDVMNDGGKNTTNTNNNSDTAANTDSI